MESDTMTPSVLRYSDQIPQMAPQMDFNYVSMIPSNGAVFSANQEVRIPINVAADSFVDMKRAYIRFKVANTAAAGGNHSLIALDPICGAASFISRFAVVGGTGNLLEEIQHYDALVSVMNINKNESVIQSRGSITMGTSQGPMSAVSISDVAGNAVAALGGKQTIEAQTSKVFYHEPVSAVFNADKLMPWGFTQGTSYVSLTLNSATGGACQFNDSTNDVAWEISEWELFLPVLRPGAEFANNFRTLIQSGLPINIHSVGFQNSQQNIAENATGMQTVTFSTRKRSVKSVFTALRVNALLSSKLVNSSSGFKNNNATDYQYSVGGRRIPSAPIRLSTVSNANSIGAVDIGGCYNNTLMALGHYDSNLRGSTSDSSTAGSAYAQTVANDPTLSSKCVFALDLEQYNEGLSGMNLAGQGLPLVLHLNCGATGAASTGALVADLYVVHDVIFTLDGVSGTLSASS